jgi:hypothetical protein
MSDRYNDASLTAEQQRLLTMEERCLPWALEIVNNGLLEGMLQIAWDGTVKPASVQLVSVTCGSRGRARSGRCRNRPVPSGQVG